MSTITERVKTFEDACKVLGIAPLLPDFTGTHPNHQKSLLAHYQLVIIAEALNEEWKPDWSNGEWDKWYLWFDMDDDSSSSSGRFSFYYSDVRASVSGVGSRLCFKSRELAKYAGTQFEGLYRDYFVIE